MLSSTLMNATSQPEFPADVTRVFLDGSPIRASKREKRPSQRSLKPDNETDLSELPAILNIQVRQRTRSEKEARLKAFKKRNPYYDLLGQLRDSINKVGVESRGFSGPGGNHVDDSFRPASPRALSFHSYGDETEAASSATFSSTRSRTPSRRGDDSGAETGCIRRLGTSGSDDEETTDGDRCVEKTLASVTSLLLEAAHVFADCERHERQKFWSDYAPLLSKKASTDRVADLESLAHRLQTVTRDSNGLAVALRQPPVKGLRLDEKYHADAVKALSPATLATTLDLVEAESKVTQLLIDYNWKIDAAEEGLGRSGRSPKEDVETGCFEIARRLAEDQSGLSVLVAAAEKVVRKAESV